MRILSTIAIAIAVVGCQKTPRVAPVPHSGGEYAYRMTVGPTAVAGEFSIAGDTVMLEANDHGCRNLNLGMSTLARSTTFSCVGQANFQVVVDLMQPAYSRWTSTEPVKRTRQVCDRWIVTEKGETVCAANRTEVYTANVVIGGRLQVTPLASAEQKASRAH